MDRGSRDKRVCPGGPAHDFPGSKWGSLPPATCHLPAVYRRAPTGSLSLKTCERVCELGTLGSATVQCWWARLSGYRSQFSVSASHSSARRDARCALCPVPYRIVSYACLIQAVTCCCKKPNSSTRILPSRSVSVARAHTLITATTQRGPAQLIGRLQVTRKRHHALRALVRAAGGSYWCRCSPQLHSTPLSTSRSSALSAYSTHLGRCAQVGER